MKKILFGITNLSVGGAERVLVDIVNKLSNNYNIEILTIYAKRRFRKIIEQKCFCKINISIFF